MIHGATNCLEAGGSNILLEALGWLEGGRVEEEESCLEHGRRAISYSACLART